MLRRPAPRARHSRVPAAERSEQLLRAFVLESLAKGSIAGVGVRAVVTRAGCTAPILYRLFGNRKGLVRAAVRSTHLPLIERLEALAERSRGPASQRVRRLANSYLERAPGASEAFEALVGAECHGDPELARWVRAIFARFEALLVTIVRDGIRRREFRADTDPRYAAWRLIDLGLFRNQARLMRLSVPDRIRYAERAVESLLAELAP